MKYSKDGAICNKCYAPAPYNHAFCKKCAPKERLKAIGLNVGVCFLTAAVVTLLNMYLDTSLGAIPTILIWAPFIFCLSRTKKKFKPQNMEDLSPSVQEKYLNPSPKY